jgi:hypothetical protein
MPDRVPAGVVLRSPFSFGGWVAVGTAFTSLEEQQADGLVVDADAFLTNRREQVVALASQKGGPARCRARPPTWSAKGIGGQYGMRAPSPSGIGL